MLLFISWFDDTVHHPFSSFLQTMQSYASVFRTGDTLSEGVNKVMEVYAEMEDLKVRKNE